MPESYFQVRALRVVGVVAGLLFMLGAAGSASARDPVDQVQVEPYVSSLDSSFWAQAWAHHLRAEADGDETIDWHYDDRKQSARSRTDTSVWLPRRMGSGRTYRCRTPFNAGCSPCTPIQ